MDKNQTGAATQSLEPQAPPPATDPTYAPYGQQGARKQHSPDPGLTKAADPNGVMGTLGAPFGGEGAHNGSIRGQSVGPAEGIQRFEHMGNAVGGSELARMITTIMSSLAQRSGVQPNPAPAPPAVGKVG